MNYNLKLIASKAKERLNYASKIITKEEKVKNSYLSQKDYAIVATKHTIESDPLFDKVKKIIQMGDIANPLGELTDQTVFNSLSGAEKEKYIIDISKRYNRIKDYVLDGN